MKKVTQFAKKHKKNILKIAGLVVIALLLMVYGQGNFGNNYDMPYGGAPTSKMAASDYAFSESAEFGGRQAVSSPTVLDYADSYIEPPIAPAPGPVAGNDAEDFEVTQYNAGIETKNSQKTCEQILKLKDSATVIFEQSSQYDQGCNFTFKVEKPQTTLVLDAINALNPKNISENSYTIKRQVQNHQSTVETLQAKLDSINSTLAEALAAYDAVSELSQDTRDPEVLASIIESKLTTIERLTTVQLDTIAQLDRMSRNLADQLDQLEYTYFYINVYQNKYFDGQQLSESWKAATRQAVHSVNNGLQALTVGLLGFVFGALRYIVYAILIYLAAKALYKAGKKNWNK